VIYSKVIISLNKTSLYQLNILFGYNSIGTPKKPAGFAK